MIGNQFTRVFDHPSVRIGGIVLLGVTLSAVLAPVLSSVDPGALDPSIRLQSPSADYWLGTDAFGRDVFTRIVHGGQISLLIGIGAAAIAVLTGLVIGMVAGYIRVLDAVIMRIMDGLMAIPAILLAIALVALAGATIQTVLFAITVPEIPRVVRVVRGVVLTIREEPYVEAAIASGTPVYLILLRHVMPNTMAPLIVQGTYICASAVLLEAILSFLGAGISPETPTWGNMIADGRVYFRLYPALVLVPGLMLSLTVLSINLLGDGLRDTLDPRLRARIGETR